ncbi:hypothetical protein FISHEDRAFT_73733 [Fistulina hepatica ATCC 64428]|uniref:Uncharacterized protein n=1 Tax=Fistulina hepatica ATCC 64428 TaxID=1128425 RepID=A0A0D7ACM2_9AGAR|nr:hypothetical protein FISHEDRAFT_73733 [Fistulina hepatica ATCC 64428]
MEVDGENAMPSKRVKMNSGKVAAFNSKWHPRANRQLAGLANEEQMTKAVKLRNYGQRPKNFLARAGEGDRSIRVKKPKHLFAGKRKAGRTDRR